VIQLAKFPRIQYAKEFLREFFTVNTHVLLHLIRCRAEPIEIHEPMNGHAKIQWDLTEAMLASCGFNQPIIRKLAQYLACISEEGYVYPWKGLEEKIAHLPDGRLFLIGYGSLLSKNSALRSLEPSSVEDSRPVLALGARRVFNYAIPEDKLKAYGEVFRSRARAALNAEYTRSATDAINGRLIRVAAADISALRKREFGYDLRAVACLDWNDRRAQPFTAFVLVAIQPTQNGRLILDDHLLPNPSYYRECRTGASSISEAFLRMYLETTYLADRKTRLDEWERTHPEILARQTEK
jgi:hypothetical protein